MTTYRIYKEGNMFGFEIRCTITGSVTRRLGYYDRASAMFAAQHFSKGE